MIKKINLIKNKEYFYILGVLLGDGNILYNRIRIALKDKDFIFKCQKCIKICLKEKCKIKKRKNNRFKNSYLYHLNFNSIIISQIIQQDLKKIHKLKNKKKFISFLEGIYDSEGCVDKDRVRIRLIMRDYSKRTINLISIFLTYLKINFIIRKFRAKNRDWIIITINEKNSIIFHQHIHFSIKRKQKRLENYYKIYQKKWEYETKKREEVMSIPEKVWCKKYSLTRNQYYRHKRQIKL